MINLKSKKITQGLLILSLPVVFAFQNCSQKGDIVLTDSVTGQKATSDDFVVDPQPLPDMPAPNPVISDGVNDGSEEEDPIPTPMPTPTPTVDSSLGTCQGIEIADFSLAVIQVSQTSNASSKSSMFSIVDPLEVITLDDQQVHLVALNSGKVSSVFIELDRNSNKVLSMANTEHQLKTPSAQQSGLKVRLDMNYSVVAGKKYKIQLNINPADQIISNPVKCLFRPVVKSAKLIEII